MEFLKAHIDYIILGTLGLMSLSHAVESRRTLHLLRPP